MRRFSGRPTLLLNSDRRPSCVIRKAAMAFMGIPPIGSSCKSAIEPTIDPAAWYICSFGNYGIRFWVCVGLQACNVTKCGAWQAQAGAITI